MLTTVHDSCVSTASPLSALTILKGEIAISFLTASELNLGPIRRLIEYRVFSGLVTAPVRAAFVFSAASDDDD